ncbi:S41 family peptidase [Cochleicola gelatinilyticus]|uniref:Peptidase S41 n=1 Tax=Cochleicola gelatinilyticus TaxID=1763537 RepID=A0A167IQU2_9FLAO|nr:S41 family peptidase [Cochleicola gelatinilyticus]OAB79920.1 peptidase S41 [Cochleicola gelatinilyticus]
MKIYFIILLSIFTLSCKAQSETEYLSKAQIERDLAIVDDILQNKSSYQGLNGYDYRVDFENYLITVVDNKITQFDFGLFLSKTIGKIGDRHSFIKDYDIRDSLYLTLAFAPFKDKVLVVDFDRDIKEYKFWNSEFPYLHSINKTPIQEILPKIHIGEILAPKDAYATSAIRDLRDIETIFRTLKLELPNPLPITLSDNKGNKKEISVKLVDGKNRATLWDERFFKNTFRVKEEQYNDIDFIKRFFSLKNNVGYIQIGEMLEKESCPIFFNYLNEFMTEAKKSDALIIDVRDNGGGTRDLIQELAGYFIHPDSVYVVNATKQRGKLPLNKELKERLQSRYLFSRDDLDIDEQNAVDKFMHSFEPMYDLSKEKFSEFHYYILNGHKITKGKFHYNKPIYILANERSFSAASVLVSVFKNLPNIKIVGVNTDGSSGNSERFELPSSELRGKISTMVSFQKNGKILDGIGTEPDIKIERSLKQIFLKEDYQLNRLLEIIEGE